MADIKKDSLEVDEITEMLEDNYVPSISERKKVAFYYILIGIFITLSNKQLSRYEYFHLRQAIWWWTVFFVLFVISMFVFFLPFLKIIPFLLFLLLLWIWLVFVKYAWEWKYAIDLNWEKKIFAPIFMWIWNWILNLFDVKFEILDLNK